jgi:hypothetical protein
MKKLPFNIDVNGILVNFINILQADFALKFFCQKKSKPNCNLRKAVQSTFVQKNFWSKVLMKMAPCIRCKFRHQEDKKIRRCDRSKSSEEMFCSQI